MNTVLTSIISAAAIVIVGLAGLIGARITAKGAAHASPYDALAERVLRLEAQHDEDELQREADRTKIAGLERRLSMVIEDRDALVRYITTFREWVALGARPPAPTVPQHLRDVIPNWMPADGQRD